MRHGAGELCKPRGRWLVLDPVGVEGGMIANGGYRRVVQRAGPHRPQPVCLCHIQFHQPTGPREVPAPFGHLRCVSIVQRIPPSGTAIIGDNRLADRPRRDRPPWYYGTHECRDRQA